MLNVRRMFAIDGGKSLAAKRRTRSKKCEQKMEQPDGLPLGDHTNTR